ncbi:hypothetical protein CTheo_3626 [Ceratobasidium theobromae]|uniref:Uncharacterized protein n=1 Tax=Ceratobasidium theobromae TaxID=1582974 RepID=A0A5N5QMB4_9AGAM|nr:hypothetical protein CTheo_3626 [Ceratobasidium theobromae]
MPEPTREPAQSGETEPGSINQVREWIRELQQRFSVTNENPGEAYPDLFNVENGSISDDAPERIFQRLQEHFLFSPPSRQDDRREYSGMYS